MMYQRIIVAELQDLMSGYPVVNVTGPRQSGKTTLVRTAFPEKAYVSLEDFDTRQHAISDPRDFLEQFPDGAILDEVQRAPILLSYIQGIVDEKDQPGMFILTGSHRFEMNQAITQSLAGRTALLTLFPMSLYELREAGISQTLDEAILSGGYPRVHRDQLDPTKAYRNYFQTYVERDLRELIHVKDLNQFEKFVTLCAGRVGHIVNYESLSNEVGVSSHTIKAWVSILEASYVVFRLQPYYENFGKRVIKSPKLYFTDVGLASYLLGIENVGQLKRDPLRGHLVENLIVLELFKARSNQGLNPNLFFFRDVRKNEVDIIYKQGHELIPIEIKSSRTFNSEFLKSLKFFQDLVGDRAPRGYLIYTGDAEHKKQSLELVNYMNASAIVNHRGLG